MFILLKLICFVSALIILQCRLYECFPDLKYLPLLSIFTISLCVKLSLENINFHSPLKISPILSFCLLGDPKLKLAFIFFNNPSLKLLVSRLINDAKKAITTAKVTKNVL